MIGTLRAAVLAGALLATGDAMAETEITILDLPTAFFHRWIDGLARGQKDLPVTVKKLIVGGEVLHAAAVRQWNELPGSERVSIFNSYGPAEATVVVTYEKIEAANERISVGKVVSNTSSYAIGRRGRIRPVGLDGEVYLCGE